MIRKTSPRTTGDQHGPAPEPSNSSPNPSAAQSETSRLGPAYALLAAAVLGRKPNPVQYRVGRGAPPPVRTRTTVELNRSREDRVSTGL
jgi:hypothetical protein